MTTEPTTQAGRDLDELVHETPRILAIEAEARDATGLADNEPKGKPVRSSPSLREALEHLLDSAVEVDVRAQTPEGDDAFVHAMTFEAMDRARAALAAAPPEPRIACCPHCGEELSTAPPEPRWIADYSDGSAVGNPEPRCVGCGAVWDEAHERLAARIRLDAPPEQRWPSAIVDEAIDPNDPFERGFQKGWNDCRLAALREGEQRP